MLSLTFTTNSYMNDFDLFENDSFDALDEKIRIYKESKTATENLENYNPLADDRIEKITHEVLGYPNKEPVEADEKRTESQLETQTVTSSVYTFLLADDSDESLTSNSSNKIIVYRNRDMSKLPKLMDLDLNKDFEIMDEKKPYKGRPASFNGQLDETNNNNDSVPSRQRSMSDTVLVCGYCKSLGIKQSHSHTRDNCAQLFSMPPCKICGAFGTQNHTETYCPSKKPVYLKLKESFLNKLASSRSLNSDDKLLRNPQLYSEWRQENINK